MQAGSQLSGPTLEEVVEAFKRWRATRPRRRAIPPELWQAAVELSSKYPLSHISRSLGLSYPELKKRASVFPERKEAGTPCPEFIELNLGRRIPAHSCVLERVDKEGVRTTMTIEVAEGSDLRKLVTAFCRVG